MEKETNHNLFTEINDQYAALGLIEENSTDYPPFIPPSNLTLRKYGAEIFLRTIDTHLRFIETSEANPGRMGQLYRGYAGAFRQEAQELKTGPLANEMNIYAAYLYMKAAISEQGITAENAHSVVCCLSHLGDAEKEERE